MRVLRTDRSAAASNVVRRAGIGLAAFLAVMVGGAHGTQDAVANGDTRTLSLYNNNTKESLTRHLPAQRPVRFSAACSS